MKSRTRGSLDDTSPEDMNFGGEGDDVSD